MTNLQRFNRVARAISVPAALRAVGVDPGGTRDSTTPVGRAIVARVAAAHGIDPARIYDRERTYTAHRARVDCIREMRAIGWSTPRIGREVMRDHSTVLYNLRRWR